MKTEIPNKEIIKVIDKRELTKEEREKLIFEGENNELSNNIND